MANTYKNIVITPNRDTDAANVPFIRFSGGDATSNTDINVRVYTTQSGTLSFEGSAGQLFSITNDLTNTIFSVNDVSGIPSLEIDAAGLIKLAEFGGNVAIGRSNASHKFDIVGTANASNLLVNGNMVFTAANDGAGSNFDADLLDGQQGAYYGIATDVSAANRVANAAFLNANAGYAFANSAHAIANLAFVHANAAYTQANAAIASASAGQATANAAFTRANNSLLSSAYTAADVLAKLITVDGAGTTLDADLLDGQQGAYYAIAADDLASHRVANAAFLHANAAFATANVAFANANTVMISSQSAFTLANNAYLHANAAFASANAGQATANAAFTRANNSLLSSAYTAADVLAKLITVDGAGTTLDADLLDGQQGTYYGIAADVTAAFLRANNSLLSSAYTAADVLAKLITVDGAGTTLDADLLDGQQGAYYGIAADVTAAFLRANNSLLSSAYTAADVLSKLLTVDGAGTTLDADLLDGQQGAYYAIAADDLASHRVANAAFLHANAAFAFGNSAHSIANLAFTHANNAYATANGRVSSVSGTGTVSGLTLTGTVTTTGSLTLGGTLSASVIDNMTDEHRLFNNMGDTHSSRTAFDLNGPSINFGWRFVQGSANGPGVSGTQFYSEYVGLGNEYNATGAGSYGMQIAYPRNVTEPYITIRYNEANTFAAWTKVSAGNSDKLNSQAASYYGIATDVTAANRVANAAFLHANSAFATVNSAFATINVAFANANTVMISAQAAFTVANNAYLHANAAFATANTGQTTAVAAFARANNSLLSSSYTAADVLAKLITVDGSGTTLDADLLDGQQGTYYGIAADVTAAFLRANNSLLSSSYTAADVLSKLITVDGAGTSLDADLLDGQQGTYYGIAADVTAAFLRANNSLLSSAYTAADVLAKLVTVDGAGTNLDADLLDGQQGTYYGIAADVTAAFLRANNSLLSSAYTAADVLSKLITVDGAGTNLDADLLDGQQGAYYAIAADDLASHRVANAAFLHANAAFATANVAFANANTVMVSAQSAFTLANNAYLHANAAFTAANTGQTTAVAAFLRANNSLLSSAYTAADVLAKLITVDGAGTSLDADLLDGQQGTYYGIAADVTAAFLRANNSLLSSAYTAADVLAKLITVDGAGTSLDADLLDGQQGTYYGIAADVTAAFLRANNSLLSSSYTAADVLAKLITVDGAGTSLDADLLDGQQGAYYGISTDVAAANRVANAAFLHANAAFLQANTGGVGPAFEQANTARTHANQAFAKANTIGTLGTQASSSVTITGGSITGITDLAVADGGTGASDAATARTNLGLVIGTNVQAYDADLAAIAALAPTADNFIVGNGTAWILETPASARTSLGLGTIATQASSSVSITGGSITGITDLAVADGGTGASDAATARTNLGLVIGTNVQAYSANYLVTTGNQTLTGGFNVTPYSLGTGSGTVTPSGLNGNYQYITNNAAFTIAAPGTDSAIDILVTNGATAGSITFSGYTAGAANGSIYALTNANRYLLSIRRINSIATFSWYALQ